MLFNQGSFMDSLNNELTENERVFKLSSVAINKDESVVIKFIIDATTYDSKFTSSLKEKVKHIISKVILPDYTVHIVFEKTNTTPDRVQRLLYEYVYQELPIAYDILIGSPVDIYVDDGTINIRITLSPFIFDFLRFNEYDERFSVYLETKFMENVSLELIRSKDGNPKSTPTISSTTAENSLSIDIVPATITNSILGNISHAPRYIADILTSESELRTVCGVVSNFKQQMSKSSDRIFFTFRLTDNSASILVKFFPKTEKRLNAFANNVSDGVLLCVEGPVYLDKYSPDYSLVLFRAAFCECDFNNLTRTHHMKAEPVSYVIVHPQPYTLKEQISVFAETIVEIPHLLRNDIVVFDFETTGLLASSCYIIEIGAVKIRNGIIVETFSSFVNPNNTKIPSEITKLTGITDSNVRHSPVWSEIVGDFFKFTRDATLAAHNIEFDMKFLTHHSKDSGFYFKNESIDTMLLARSRVNLSNYKLETLLKHFNILNPSAHRAIHDAISTAKLLIKLAELQ
jgi:DNA polymerase III epsilon subunit family exonuclease